MANFFDQFDAAPKSQNFFDQFDAPSGAAASPAQAEVDAIATKAEAQAANEVNVVDDTMASLGAGVVKGFAHVAGIGGDIENGTRWLKAKATGQEYAPRETMFPTSEQVIAGINSVPGVEIHTPQTKAGEYAETVGSFAPAVIGGGGSVLPRVALRVVAPGVATQAAGDAVSVVDPRLEGPTRLAAALLAGNLAAAPRIAGTAAKYGISSGVGAAGSALGIADPISAGLLTKMQLDKYIPSMSTTELAKALTANAPKSYVWAQGADPQKKDRTK